MRFPLERYKSEKFYRLRFKGFTPNKKVGQLFLMALGKYVIQKIIALLKLIADIFNLVRIFPNKVKDYLIKKLIWSRGKLGRPIANLAVMLIAFVVFTFGEILNSTRFVSGGEVDPDYLLYTSDIIPNVNTAQTLVPESRKSTESFVYNVAPGDTLSAIGQKFKISTDAIKYVNNLTDYSVLKVGQEITVPPISGLIHNIADGDTLSSIAKKYDVPSQAIADFNYILDTSKLAVGSELVIPGAKIPQPVYVPPVYSAITPTGPLVQASPSKNFCVWPSSTRIITQYYTWYHNGIDIATQSGRPMPPLFACTDGTVTRSGWDPFGLGLHIRVSHGNGYETIYGHMSAVYVSYGQTVSRGDVLGLMGSTGNSTGPHVHFMVNFNGIPQNPLNYVN